MPKSNDRIVVLLWGLAAIAVAVATLQVWSADDAFISFRYAENLAEGRGLVFNPGERVEGFSNFLWTIWIAAGLKAGIAAERWSHIWGAACYLAAIALLVWNHAGLRAGIAGARTWIPVAALGAALHRDWSVFATSGLETGAFTLLLVAGYLLALRAVDDSRLAVLAGLVFALGALTRPDGVLPAAIVGGFLLVTSSRRIATSSLYLAGFIAIWLPYTVWRMSYFGDYFPNTYYAKSAWLPWYEQGWHYVGLYFEKYWPLAFGPLLLALSFVVRPRDELDRVLRPQIVLASLLAAGYTFYVVRVGGDFMFARFLVPATPFFLVLLEAGWIRLLRTLPIQGLAVALVLVGGIAFTPSPVSGDRWRHGIADEQEYFSGQRLANLEHKADVLARVFDGVPVRVAFFGDEARVVYRARFEYAFEAHAGLTEPEVARQPIEKRRRPGHEKHASAIYLIEQRRTDITFSAVPQKLLRLKQFIPEVIVEFDVSVTGQLLRWNPDLVERMIQRGARVPPFIAMLDGYLANLDALPDDRVLADWPRFKRFYFDAVDDPARESIFRSRLDGIGR